MKRTKKMIMIPAAEYDAIIAQLRSQKDPLQSEKAEIEQKISKTLDDNKVDANLKRKRVGWLKKQRKELKGQIENRKLKVELAQPAAGLPQANFAPYLGVQEQKTPKYEGESSFESAFSDEKPSTEETKERHSLDSPPIISPQYAKELHNYVTANKEKFRIKEDGRFETWTRSRLVGNSDYRKVLDYMLGREDEVPKGNLFLTSRLLKDDRIKGWRSQEGKGKKRRRRVAVRLDAIKTGGPFVFRPKLWEKLF